MEEATATTEAHLSAIHQSLLQISATLGRMLTYGCVNATSSPDAVVHAVVPAKCSTVGLNPNIGAVEVVDSSQQSGIVSTVNPGLVGAPPSSTMQRFGILKSGRHTPNTCSTGVLDVDTDAKNAKRDAGTLQTDLHMAEPIADSSEEVLTHVRGVSLFLEPSVQPAEVVFSAMYHVELEGDVFSTVGGMSPFLKEGLCSANEVCDAVLLEDVSGSDEVLTNIGGLSLFLEFVQDVSVASVDQVFHDDPPWKCHALYPWSNTREGSHFLLVNMPQNAFHSGHNGMPSSYLLIDKWLPWSRSGFSPGLDDCLTHLFPLVCTQPFGNFVVKLQLHLFYSGFSWRQETERRKADLIWFFKVTSTWTEHAVCAGVITALLVKPEHYADMQVTKTFILFGRDHADTCGRDSRLQSFIQTIRYTHVMDHVVNTSGNVQDDRTGWLLHGPVDLIGSHAVGLLTMSWDPGEQLTIPWLYSCICGQVDIFEWIWLHQINEATTVAYVPSALPCGDSLDACFFYKHEYVYTQLDGKGPQFTQLDFRARSCIHYRMQLVTRRFEILDSDTMQPTLREYEETWCIGWFPSQQNTSSGQQNHGHVHMMVSLAPKFSTVTYTVAASVRRCAELFPPHSLLSMVVRADHSSTEIMLPHLSPSGNHIGNLVIWSVNVPWDPGVCNELSTKELRSGFAEHQSDEVLVTAWSCDSFACHMSDCAVYWDYLGKGDGAQQKYTVYNCHGINLSTCLVFVQLTHLGAAVYSTTENMLADPREAGATCEIPLPRASPVFAELPHIPELDIAETQLRRSLIDDS